MGKPPGPGGVMLPPFGSGWDHGSGAVAGQRREPLAERRGALARQGGHGLRDSVGTDANWEKRPPSPPTRRRSRRTP